MSSKCKNIISLVAAVNSVVAFVVYYHVALTTGVKLKEMYFLSISINFSMLFMMLFFYIKNVYIEACLLGAGLFFGGLSIAFIIDWIGNDIPKMNHVYLCLMVSVTASLLIILYRYGQRIIIRKLSRMDH